MVRRFILIILCTLACSLGASAQINTDQVMRIGRNTLYFEDYVLSIQYFNQVINAKPHLAQPYFYRAIAKLNLEDYLGAEADASLAIERNPFITDAYEVRAVARQNMGKLADAVADYDAALADMPVNRGVLYNKALALTDMKDYARADSTFEVLIDAFPKFDSAYLGRARMRLLTTDTVAATADIDRALAINRNAVNGYIMRADIAINSHRDYPSALADMNEAIKLQPRYAGFFINRAFLRYMTDDYYGAMADYDYALQLEPDNTVALFNRGMLRSEVHDINKAIDDFSQVLRIDPTEYKAMYNRAMLLADTGDFDAAISDLDTVIAAYPQFAAAYFMRYDVKRRKGDMNGAKTDYDRSMALAGGDDMTPAIITDNTSGDTKPETQEEVKRRFESLATVDDNSEPDQVYSNQNIRGKVQDRNISIEIEPMFALTYYTSPTELKQSGDYIKEADEVNSTRALRFLLQVTNHIPAMNDEDVIRAHFSSIDYYTSYLSTHKARPIDYFGRAMDYITTRNYTQAITDLDRAIALAPDFTVAYLMRADARAQSIMTDISDEPDKSAPAGAQATLASHEARDGWQMVIDDLDMVAKLSPQMAIAHYNKGVVLTRLQDYTSALRAFTRAIELKPDFGEAYYNRGYVYLHLGNRDAGTSDLSKAGELGIVPSYNLLKRMNR
ncbi:MAG: tetratricopeptide repeat protein [Duncaniella sp.]|nr:tetratricopeptide repeat protein [Duncaniella sp.]